MARFDKSQCNSWQIQIYLIIILIVVIIIIIAYTLFRFLQLKLSYCSAWEERKEFSSRVCCLVIYDASRKNDCESSSIVLVPFGLSICDMSDIAVLTFF